MAEEQNSHSGLQLPLSDSESKELSTPSGSLQSNSQSPAQPVGQLIGIVISTTKLPHVSRALPRNPTTPFTLTCCSCSMQRRKAETLNLLLFLAYHCCCLPLVRSCGTLPPSGWSIVYSLPPTVQKPLG